MRRFSGSFVLAMCFAAVAAAQQLSQLSGTVTDPSGAVVVGATVRLDSMTRGVMVREVTTGGEGRYAFPQILPDNYKLTAKAQGFNDVLVSNVRVLVATPSSYDIQFEKVGAVAESVSVSAEGTNLNTVDATLGDAITSHSIVQLPSFARNMAKLLQLQPGVNEFGNVNGGKSDQANVTLDGIDVNEQQERTSFTSVLRVTIDSVEEFRTTTTGANADQGRSSGAQVSLVTRSGSNDWHGSAYWYNRNTATAAAGFFNNLSGVNARPDENGKLVAHAPKLLINIPGVRVGGPIIKNKLFFFANWEMRQDRSESNESRVVPSAELRQSMVKYHDRTGAVITLSPAEVQQLDPLKIGANQKVLALFNTYPLPNDDSLGDGLNFKGYRFNAPLQTHWNTYITRLDYQAKPNHNFFLRAQLQNDHGLALTDLNGGSSGAPQFPGDPYSSIYLANAKGVAVGYNTIISTNLVSNFRYGLTRFSRESTGLQNQSAISFRELDDRYALTTGIARLMPLHQFSEDLSWTKGKHSVQFGAIARLISNQSTNYLKSFFYASTNVSWLRGTGSDFSPPNLAAADRTAYGDAMMALLGIVSEVDSNYNNTIDGKLLPVGAPVSRNFKNEEYELYAQDSYKLKKNLTLTVGLRWSLMPPVHEADGVQISTNIPLGDWFNTRGALADQGKSQEEAGRITFIRADDPKARPIYPFYKGLVAPRLAVAYSPIADSPWKRFLLGSAGKTSIRAGWGMFYDLVGQPLARTFDENAFGFATTLVNPSGRLTASTAPRFTGLYDIPASLIRTPGALGFPATFPDDSENGFAITNSIDDKLKIPYTMNMNFTLEREFGNGWLVRGSYVGRMSRRSLINRDLAMPTNLKDPTSGQTYFEAATTMFRMLNANVPVTSMAPIPFFENMFPAFKSSTRTATQNVYNVARGYGNDFVSTLADIDEFCDPCGRLGPNMMMNPQFASLSAWSSIAGGNYHSMQWTLRKRFSAGLSLDFNYTLSKSQDLASVEENQGDFAGFLSNSWNPSQRRGVSDYDQRHVWNAYWVYELPFGKGKRFGGDAPAAFQTLLGGWQFSGVWTQSTELPISVGNGRYWPTNYNITARGTPLGAITQSTKTKNAPAVSGPGGVNVWADPAATLNEWLFTPPGQSGTRNTLRIDGLSNFDFNLAKRFQMPWSEKHSIQFRWETYNVWNQVRFSEPNVGRISTATWGKYTAQSNQPRQMQFALRYEF